MVRDVPTSFKKALAQWATSIRSALNNLYLQKTASYPVDVPFGLREDLSAWCRDVNLAVVALIDGNVPGAVRDVPGDVIPWGLDVVATIESLR